MRVLALDTTTREGSVALVENDRVISEYPTDPMRAHGERLPGDLLDLLAAHKLTLADVDLFGIAAGPGSFTGLRIGIACVQGLATVLRKPVVAVSVLEALAQWTAASSEPGATVAAWMDAHRGEVFSARYRVGNGQPFAPDRLEEIEPPTVGTASAILDRWGSGPLPGTLVGDGAVEYAYVVPESVVILEHPILSGAIGRIAAARAARGQVVGPAAIQPIYVRRPDAELARERRLGEHAGA